MTDCKLLNKTKYFILTKWLMKNDKLHFVISISPYGKLKLNIDNINEINDHFMVKGIGRNNTVWYFNDIEDATEMLNWAILRWE